VGITAGSREVPGRNVCDRRHTYRIIIIIIIIITIIIIIIITIVIIIIVVIITDQSPDMKIISAPSIHKQK